MLHLSTTPEARSLPWEHSEVLVHLVLFPNGFTCNSPTVECVKVCVCLCLSAWEGVSQAKRCQKIKVHVIYFTFCFCTVFIGRGRAEGEAKLSKRNNLYELLKKRSVHMAGFCLQNSFGIQHDAAGSFE